MQNTKKEGTDKDLDLQKGFTINFPIPFFGVAKENVDISEKNIFRKFQELSKKLEDFFLIQLFDILDETVTAFKWI